MMNVFAILEGTKYTTTNHKQKTNEKNNIFRALFLRLKRQNFCYFITLNYISFEHQLSDFIIRGANSSAPDIHKTDLSQTYYNSGSHSPSFFINSIQIIAFLEMNA